jgi:hypothetical protein
VTAVLAAIPIITAGRGRSRRWAFGAVAWWIALGAVVALLQIEPPPAGHDQPALLGDNLEAIAREVGIAIAAVIGLFGLFLQLTISAHARAASAARAPR